MVARNDSDKKEMSEEEKAENNMILERARDAYSFLYIRAVVQ